MKSNAYVFHNFYSNNALNVSYCYIIVELFRHAIILMIIEIAFPPQLLVKCFLLKMVDLNVIPWLEVLGTRKSRNYEKKKKSLQSSLISWLKKVVATN